MRRIDLKKLLNEARNRKERRLVIFFMVKLGYTKLPPLDKVSLAEHVVEKMTGNANFPTPMPTLASVSTAAAALYAAENALDGTKEKTEIRNAAEKALDKKMKQLQAYVDAAADGDKVIILSSGMNVNDTRTPSVILDPPTNLQANNTATEGQIKLRFSSLRKKVAYIIEVAQEFPGALNWQIAAESTKATVYINDLQPGTRYHVRVRVFNAAGLSAPSEEVVCRTTIY